MRTILDAIGSTPLIQIDGIWIKLEFLNPSGSIKARIAKYMIERAEREGLLKPGDTIAEASSGNTGNAMSMVAAVKGYKMLVVMPNGMSRERTAISRAFGAEVRTIGDFHVNDALAEVRRLGDLPGYFAPQQFDNEWNVDENREWLAQEILAQLPAGMLPDAVIGGVGTGGTIIGVGQAFKAVNPACKVVALEPSESCTILCGEIRAPARLHQRRELQVLLHRLDGIKSLGGDSLDKSVRPSARAAQARSARVRRARLPAPSGDRAPCSSRPLCV